MNALRYEKQFKWRNLRYRSNAEPTKPYKKVLSDRFKMKIAILNYRKIMTQGFIVLLIVVLGNEWASGQQADILIRNGKIINGTGNGWFYGDIAICGDRITAIGRLNHFKADTVINADGKIVSPGFIDVHTHIEGNEHKNAFASNFVRDGVTTVITGNCGSSSWPIGSYLKSIEAAPLAVNMASLAGHNDIRKAVMGEADRAPTLKELADMKSLMNLAMQEGAMGLSTGLIYIPGTYAGKDEIIELAKIAAAHNGVYATHMRDEGDSIIPAIREAVDIGRSANIPVQISHLKLAGPQNWGRSVEILDMIQHARDEGLDVTVDQYPYTASSTSLSTLLPDHVLADHQDSLSQRIKNPEIRDRVLRHMLERLQKKKLHHFSYAVVAWYGPDTTLNGMTIEQINLFKNRPHHAAAECATILDLLELADPSMIFHGMSEEDVTNFEKYEFNIPASDASIRIYNEGMPHPRGYGTHARFFSRYVKEKKLCSIEEAIRRMTSLPAQKFNLTERGLLLPGYYADLVIFDENDLQDNASFEVPHQYTTGLYMVMVNGQITLVADIQLTTRSGRVLYGPGYRP
jgi:N-acyl-D-amino-acid deacylase